MTRPNLLELAKQGDPQAIANLMNRSLQPKGLTAKTERVNDVLQVILEANQVPNREVLTTFVHNGLQKLGVQSIHSVRILGKQTEAEVPAWTHDIELTPPRDRPLTEAAAAIAPPPPPPRPLAPPPVPPNPNIAPPAPEIADDPIVDAADPHSIEPYTDSYTIGETVIAPAPSNEADWRNTTYSAGAVTEGEQPNLSQPNNPEEFRSGEPLGADSPVLFVERPLEQGFTSQPAAAAALDSSFETSVEFPPGYQPDVYPLGYPSDDDEVIYPPETASDASPLFFREDTQPDPSIEEIIDRPSSPQPGDINEFAPPVASEELVEPRFVDGEFANRSGESLSDFYSSDAAINDYAASDDYPVNDYPVGAEPSEGRYAPTAAQYEPTRDGYDIPEAGYEQPFPSAVESPSYPGEEDVSEVEPAENRQSQNLLWGVAFATVVFIFGILGFVGFDRFFSNPDEETPTPAPTTAQVEPVPASPPPASPSPAVSPSPAAPDPYQQAVDLEARTLPLEQQAQSADDWNLVATQWQQAIALLQQVPANTPNYNAAQQKLGEYQAKLSNAQQLAANPPSPSVAPSPPATTTTVVGDVACQEVATTPESRPIELSGLQLKAAEGGAAYLVGCMTNHTGQAIANISVSFLGTSAQDANKTQGGFNSISAGAIPSGATVPFQTAFTFDPGINNVRIDAIFWTPEGTVEPQRLPADLTVTR